jgi:mono/diheme cytochrome c family protein
MRVFLMVLFSVLLLPVSAYADGDANRGKSLFNNPMLSGSSFDVSCNTCHPNGRGLENAGDETRKKWKSCSGENNSLSEAINTCILAANRGKPIAPESQEMKDLVAYIKTLAKKAIEK